MKNLRLAHLSFLLLGVLAVTGLSASNQFFTGKANAQNTVVSPTLYCLGPCKTDTPTSQPAYQTTPTQVPSYQVTPSPAPYKSTPTPSYGYQTTPTSAYGYQPSPTPTPCTTNAYQTSAHGAYNSYSTPQYSRPKGFLYTISSYTAPYGIGANPNPGPTTQTYATNPCQPTPTPIAYQVTPTPLPYNVVTATPQPYQVVTETPQPYYVVTATPQPYYVVTATPQPYYVVTATPTPSGPCIRYGGSAQTPGQPSGYNGHHNGGGFLGALFRLVFVLFRISYGDLPPCAPTPTPVVTAVTPIIPPVTVMPSSPISGSAIPSNPVATISPLVSISTPPANPCSGPGLTNNSNNQQNEVVLDFLRFFFFFIDFLLKMLNGTSPCSA
ncbi:MAG: hypothetical protein ACR2LN_00100 [Candidatus Levyibacteriota bacterium]